MIQIEELHIEEFRGIRKLPLILGARPYCIYGPNGSGKSGVVDAIEFALTGDISRLSGEGTGGITVSKHGAHVDRRDDPEAAFVRLKLRILATGDVVTITRRLKNVKELVVEPDTEAVREVLDRVARHPEITLSRREIIKFILTGATDRSRNIQTLLKLDEIDHTRSVLKSTVNKVGQGHKAAAAQSNSAEDDLRRHLDVAKLTAEASMEAVNKRRAVLGLAGVGELKGATVSEGVEARDEEAKAAVHKKSALSDLAALKKALDEGLDAHTGEQVEGILENVAKLAGDPALLTALRKRAFVETGLGLVEGPSCPLCDAEWEEDELRAHLEAKLEQSKLAEALQSGLLSAGSAVRTEVQRGRDRLQGAAKIAARVEAAEFAKVLNDWDDALKRIHESLVTVDGLVSLKETLEAGWADPPEGVLVGLEAAAETVSALPDETATADARKFLIIAQDRLEKVRQADREEVRLKRASDAASRAYSEYCEASEAVLSELYKEVEEDFAEFYRVVNKDDEAEFDAALSPSQGKLDLSVDFYKRGKFPPGAYHSEGHQDSMGVCLYLALMKRVLGENFRLAVLDDVVMSVDRDHRKAFCKLLKDKFPETQFVITTHERTWAEQMTRAGLIPSKSSVAFRGWKIETGPLVHAVEGVWEDIASDLAKDKVSGAAGTLRRHMEYVLREVANELSAAVPYRSGDEWDVGDLFPAVLTRYRELLGKAAKSAQDWSNDSAKEAAKARRDALSEKAEAYGGESWMINKSIHFNEWVDLTSAEFEPVVTAFRGILEELCCAKCEAWLQVAPKRLDADTLSCDCGEVSLKLKGT